METKKPTLLDQVLQYNPPIAELIFGFFGLAVLTVLFGVYLSFNASMELNWQSGHIHVLQFDVPTLGPDRIVTRYGTYLQSIFWRTLTVAMDISLVLGVMACALAGLLAAIRKLAGR